MGQPDIPEPLAKRPERIIDVEPEEIELGSSEDEEGINLKTQGKRALIKPSSKTGVNV